jgi:hypothetical protein
MTTIAKHVARKPVAVTSSTDVQARARNTQLRARFPPRPAESWWPQPRPLNGPTKSLRWRIGLPGVLEESSGWEWHRISGPLPHPPLIAPSPVAPGGSSAPYENSPHRCPTKGIAPRRRRAGPAAVYAHRCTIWAQDGSAVKKQTRRYRRRYRYGTSARPADHEGLGAIPLLASVRQKHHKFSSHGV